MNIFIVSEYFYPDAFRINDIVSELVLRGHQVRVLTGLPDYTASRIPKQYKFFRRRREMFSGAQVTRVPTIARRKGVLFRALSYGSFILSASAYALFARKKGCDVVWVYQTSPVFQAIPAVLLRKRWRCKLALYCCDLWPESLKAWDVPEQSLLYRMVGRLSGALYRACDEVSISSEPFSGYLREVCGVQETRISYLPQHAEDLYKGICGKYEENGCIDFLFAGNIGAVQDVECIIRACKGMRTEKRYCVHIVGDGSSLEACKTLAEELGLDESQLRFHGRHPVEEMERFYTLADCFLLTLRGGDFIGMTLPSKAQGYLSAGKPIAAAIDGAAAQMMIQADCGKGAPAGDSEGLARAMDDIADHFEQYKEKGRNGRQFYENHYTKEKFMDSLMGLLGKI